MTNTERPEFQSFRDLEIAITACSCQATAIEAILIRMDDLGDGPEKSGCDAALWQLVQDLKTRTSRAFDKFEEAQKAARMSVETSPEMLSTALDNCRDVSDRAKQIKNLNELAVLGAADDGPEIRERISVLTSMVDRQADTIINKSECIERDLNHGEKVRRCPGELTGNNDLKSFWANDDEDISAIVPEFSEGLLSACRQDHFDAVLSQGSYKFISENLRDKDPELAKSLKSAIDMGEYVSEKIAGRQGRIERGIQMLADQCNVGEVRHDH